MENGIWYQLILFVVFFSLGMLSALAYDTFRIVRTGFWVTLIKDMIFLLLLTIFVFGTCLAFNDGKIRVYMFVGIFSGALIYFNTLSKYVLKLMRFVLAVLIKTINLILKILLMPVKLLLKLLHKPVFLAFSFSKRGVRGLGKKIRFKIKVFKKFKR